MPRFEQVSCRTYEEASTVLQSSTHAHRASLERLIAAHHRDENEFLLPGICRVDEMAVLFLVDHKWGATQLDDGTWLPNWRERLECQKCGLNNRQRAVATAVLDELDRRPAPNQTSIWIMEQLTPTYRILQHRMNRGTCVGSEYVGPRWSSGDTVDGVRHEDAEQTSFADESLDIIVSNDVLEHVPHPKRAIEEAARILRPGGVLFFTIPFYHDRHDSATRAEIIDGRTEHRLTPEYHGDPFSGGRSLVHTDFGWDFLETVRSRGFGDCAAILYWSLEYGHLGGSNFWFVARR